MFSMPLVFMCQKIVTHAAEALMVFAKWMVGERTDEEKTSTRGAVT